MDRFQRNRVRGYRNQLQGLVNTNRNGATVELDLTSAKGLVDLLDDYMLMGGAFQNIKSAIDDYDAADYQRRGK